MSPAPKASSTPRKSALAFVLCALVVAAFTIGLLAYLQGLKAPALMEIPRKDLVLRDGLLYKEGDTAPFTGMTADVYGGGELKSQSLISNGLPEGLSIGFYTNGVKQVEEYFHAGVSHGVRTKWYENGTKLSTVMIVDGKLEGIFQRWHLDGSVAEQVELKEGVPDGVSRAYYPSGFLKAKAHLREGEVLDQQFWDDGEFKQQVATAE